MDKILRKLDRGRTVFLLLFFLFLLGNLHCLLNPPYWDEVLGLHNQAQWLAAHHFDLVRLFVPEESYIRGGSLVYQPVAILPFLYGALYRALPAKSVFLLGHLLNIALLAGAGTLLYLLIRSFQRPGLSWLWVAAAFSEPILTGRMAAMGQEAALTFALMLSFFYFFRRKDGRALAAALLAYGIKLTGLLALLVYLTWAVCALLLTRERRTRIRALRLGGVSLLLLGAIAYVQSLTASFPQPQADFWGIQNMGFSLLWDHCRLYYLWIFPVTAAAFVLYLRLWFRERRHAERRSLPALILPVFIAGYFAAYFLISVMQPLPRYTAIVLPPLYLLLAFVLREFPCRKICLLPLVLLLLHLVNQHGALLAPVPEYLRADQSYLERSREYLCVLEKDRELCRFIEKNKPPTSFILAKWPHTQMLTMPAMGYVTQPVPRVMSAGIFPKYAGACPLAPEKLQTQPFWVLYAANCMEYWFSPAFRPAAETTLLYFSADRGGSLLHAVYPCRTEGAR